ncbi:MAG: 16S rRNA (guanine(527)-N(7))-methyltransferase RsmG [Desulfococcaceae bacterium]|jgi:16S rRNA (guanine527-N7)-methyltransferase|nr:16S rRNA (guanine(527)-N(7))-methyltransferase RsmG [Desulfococcaceae bacterium]
MKKNSPSLQSMNSILIGCGIRLSGRQLDLLWQYHQLLRKYNPEFNLTRIHSFPNMVIRLYADSILPATLLGLPSPLLDVGTGPGMPGIPLKIFQPELRIILSESRGKRNEFLQTVVESLGLRGVEVLGRGLYPGSRVQCNGVITRAVENISQSLERIGGSLSREGLAFFMKGPECDAELAAAKENFAQDYELLKDQFYNIPGTPHQRRMVVFRRISAPLWQLNTEMAVKIRVTEIESEKNDTFRGLLKLLSGKGMKKAGKTLVSGSKQVEDVLRSLPEVCESWISKGDSSPPPADCPEHLNRLQLAPELFRNLDIFGTGSPLLLVKIPEMSSWDPLEDFPKGCTLLIPFQDPENVGAVIRSAVAFGVSGIVLLEGAASPFHPKSVRSSGGAVFHAHFASGPSIRELSGFLRNAGAEAIPLLSLSAEGRDISRVRFPSRFLLLPGTEGPGLPEEYRTASLAIPISPLVESLNAAVATSLVLFSWSSSLKI